ncbi:MAG: D-glycerate dehydrogenase [Candidatus Hydrogenedens sp.]|jgi:glyoxylate reductase|nr:D-glycerate dehydrogenase [Candidatus Hydrogenedens sp.]
MKIAVTRRIPEAGLKVLEAFGEVKTLAMHQTDDGIASEALLKLVEGAQAILSTVGERMDAATMDAAGPQLKIIANMAVGYDNISLAEAAKRNILVTNTPGVLTEATADLAWTLILGAARRAGEAERVLRAGQWKGWGPLQFLGVDLYKKNLGLFGLGRIGQAVARRGRGFDMTVLYHDVNRLSASAEEALNARWVEKDELIAEADILSLHCPLTPETRHAFTLAEFRKMKPSVVIVNSARGPVIKEDDLCQALDEGLVFAAGLDVFEEEPVINPRLFDHERAFLLPHIGSATIETRDTMARMAAENIVAALSGDTPENLVPLPL